MPYTAYCTDCDRLVHIQDHDGERNHDLEHPESGHPMHRVSGHEFGQTYRAAFFRRNPTYDGDSHGGGGPAETEPHVKLKWNATGAAGAKFPDADTFYEPAGATTPDTRVGEKHADGLVEFPESHHEYGHGIAIEVQHENESKDIEATTDNYAEHGYTTIWLDTDDFGDLSGRPDIDLFGGRVVTPFPRAAPEYNEDDWPADGYEHLEKLIFFEIRETHMQEPTFPFKMETFTPAEVPATFPTIWHAEELRESRTPPFWPWDEYFQHDGLDDELLGSSPDVVASIPLSWYADDLRESQDPPFWSWDEYFPDTPDDDKLGYPALRNLRYKINTDQLERQNSYDIDRPANPFDDAQCQNCATHWWVHDEHQRLYCNNCEAPIDWEWNVRTGRVPRDTAPDATEYH